MGQSVMKRRSEPGFKSFLAAMNVESIDRLDIKALGMFKLLPVYVICDDWARVSRKGRNSVFQILRVFLAAMNDFSNCGAPVYCLLNFTIK